MTDETLAPRKRSPAGRILAVFVLLALVGAGAYGASWVNAQRYFLIVEEAQVRVARGLMLPVGEAPFVPSDPELRRGYEPFPLPDGMALRRGKTIFSDRVELDQALFLLLKEATEFALAHDRDTERTAALCTQYIEQMRVLPGTNVLQRTELDRLQQDADYVRGLGRLKTAQKALKEARGLFRTAAAQGGGRYRDGGSWAELAEAALVLLSKPPAALTPVRSSSTAEARP